MIFKFKGKENRDLSVERPVTVAGAKYSLEEMLAFYMEQSRVLTEELARAKTELETAAKKIEEKEIENQVLKEALKAAEKKVARLEKKNIRLAAIEKVWKETFSKIKMVASDIGSSTSEEQDVYDLDDFNCAIDYEK